MSAGGRSAWGTRHPVNLLCMGEVTVSPQTCKYRENSLETCAEAMINVALIIKNPTTDNCGIWGHLGF